MFKIILKYNLLFTSSKKFHTNNVRCGKQVGNIVRKVFGSGAKSKKYFNTDKLPTIPINNTFGNLPKENKESHKRVKVLNKMFMKHITDLMSTGQSSQEILGHGIEVNRVQITNDYKILKVYWIARGTDKDDIIEKILQKNAGDLRHELSQLRVMGEVPKILFLKDKQYAKIIEVENRLKDADFGEDFEIPEFGSNLKSELQVLSILESDVKDKISELELNDENYNLEEEDPLPSMPQNVLGLNHDEILSRIKKSMKKSEAIHRTHDLSKIEDNWAKYKINQPINENPIVFESNNAQREAFRNFLYKRQIQKRKNNQRIDFKDINFEEQSNEDNLDNEKINPDMEDYIIEEIGRAHV